MTEERFQDPAAFMAVVAGLLVQHHISQARLGRQLGWDRSRINHYLHRRRTPSLETMISIDSAVSEIIHERQQIIRRPLGRRY
jgi:transcriptional regulator with XRE-family HTH domain